MRRSGTHVRGAVHAVGRTRTRGRGAHVTHRRLASFHASLSTLTSGRRRRGVTQGVRGLGRGRRQGGGGGGRRGTTDSSAATAPGITPVSINRGIGVGNRADIKRMVRVDNGGTVITFKDVGAAIGLSHLRHSGTTPGARDVTGDSFIDDRARSRVCRGGLDFGRSVSIHKVHKSRTLRTIACFVSSTVLINVSHMHVLRKAKAKVLHALVHRCLSAMPDVHRCTSRRIRFKNTKVAMMSFS